MPHKLPIINSSIISQTKSLCSPTSLLNYPYTQQNNMSEAEDRISNLPASLLHHILYFVPTCDAARTSVLSKRWKYIWRSLSFNCQVLEFLCMVNCTWSHMKNFCISNPALKLLFILNVEEEDGFQNCALKIHAPSLESLTYIGRAAKDYALSSIPKLVEVSILFRLSLANKKTTMTIQVMMGVKTTTRMTLLRVKITMSMKMMVGQLEWWPPDVLFSSISG
ncbi:hypothetical protein C5167_007120 [Papaver somniferum]|uniref:F-box domain-containing protein n=1 Tax=Papaver somniferum TaxID=3469 RepID=A0A4Y7JJ50_PAPSO|nr:hypothetical protein C5167_007120 [Papaver somniferum]